MELGPDIQAAVEEAKSGVIRCHVTSPYQPGTTVVRILPPDKARPPARRRVLFVLPVEAGLGTRWGDGLATVRRLKLHNRFGLLAVAPAFAQTPWYADHASDKLVRQESYLLKAVVPLVARLYPHEPERRLLLGFSKSGWGAFSLLLRNGAAFGAAAAWDAPMLMTRPAYGMAKICGTLRTFEQYRIPTLLEAHADAVKKARRLALLGYGNFRKDMHGCHRLMDRLGIPHVYADDGPRKHHWDGGWVERAVEALDKVVPE